MGGNGMKLYSTDLSYGTPIRKKSSCGFSRRIGARNVA